jgi:hypothetical protein
MIVNEESHLSPVTGSKSRLLNEAIADVRKWCAPSSEMVDGNRHPDTFWIELFDSANSSEITKNHAHTFLYSFQLMNRVDWNKAAVAALIMETRSHEIFEPLVDIPGLVNKLSECLNGRKTKQISAASKIAFFSKPKAKVFIWDRLARKSAKHRQKSASSTRSNPESNYPDFFSACERALEDERKSPEFRSAVEMLEGDFLRGKGLMADRAKIPFDFIERRLLDKLMFWEGLSLEKNKLAT